MKKIINAALLLALAMFAFTSCSSSDDSDTNTDTISSQDVVTTVQSGSWRITNYVDSNVDETNHFNGYSFVFGSDGTITATNQSIVITGTWSVDDDDSSNDVDFNISFASPPDFAELTEDWDVISRTSTRIELRDISGGNGDTDLLTFQKN